jgi:hypothetical protein
MMQNYLLLDQYYLSAIDKYVMRKEQNHSHLLLLCYYYYAFSCSASKMFEIYIS